MLTYLNIAEGNTAIINFPFSIIHSIMENAEQKLRVQHFPVVQKAGEIQLPQGFEYRDGHGIT